jgi:signal transduction histidine kinase
VTIVIDNLRLLNKTRTALEEIQRLNRKLTSESWQEFTKKELISAYRFANGNITPIENDTLESWRELKQQAIETKRLIKPANEIMMPLVLRGTVIGTLGVKREQSPNWANEEIVAIESVSNQVTLALENSRLSTEQERTIVKLQELDRLKSEFLTSMSHELRTPLNAILGFADILLQGIDGDLTEYAHNDIQLIYNSGQHLLTLINDILDISKIEAGMMEIVPEPLEVMPLIKGVMAASESLVKGKPVKIIKEIPDDLPEIYADNIRLKQILLNLVSNAIKFTSEGYITIKAEIKDDEPEMVRFSIIDTGMGIPEDKLDAIFERFKQADMTTTKEFGGTGLGLAISKQLIEMHGGRIGLHSEVGVGSVFYFTIPLVNSITINN